MAMEWFTAALLIIGAAAAFLIAVVIVLFATLWPLRRPRRTHSRDGSG
jgi:hypothetical protein